MVESARKLFTQTFLLAFPFHAAAWEAAADPIIGLLNEPDGDAKNERTELWRKSMQDQLNAIGVTSALIASVVASVFTWPAMLSPSWVVKAILYVSLVLALGAISTATQQSVILSRLAVHPDGSTILRMILSKDVESPFGRRLEPRLLQLYAWQIPISMLNGSVYFLLAGLGVLLWNAAKSVSLLWSEDDTKIVTIFMIALGYIVFNYTLSTAGMYDRYSAVRKELNLSQSSNHRR